MGFFAKEKVNRGRQPEMDWLKAFCIVCMIILHIYEDCTDHPSGFLNSTLEWICTFTGAATFMVCMGIGMRYSRNQEPKNYLLRGLELITVSQFLNIVRGAVPNLIAYWIKGEPVFIANSVLVVQADVLTFAGLAFIAMALLKLIKVPDIGILIIGVVLNVVAIPLSSPPVDTSNYLLNQFIGFFVVTEAEAYFTFFAYFVFVAFGYFIGGLYPRITDKDGLSNRILLFVTPVCVAYYVVRFTVSIPLLPEMGSSLQYLLVPGTDAWAVCLSSLVFLSLFHKISKLMGGKAPSVVNHISANINSYYCVSYVFTLPMQTLLIAVWGRLMQGMVMPTIYALIVIVLCYFIIDINEKHIHFHLVTIKQPKKAIVFAAIWVCTVLIMIYAYPKVTEYATMWNDYLLP